MELVVQPFRVADVLRERLLVGDRDPDRRHLEPPRVDPAGAVADEEADLAGQQRAQALEVGVVGLGGGFQRRRADHLLEGGVERGHPGAGGLAGIQVHRRRGERRHWPRQQRGQQDCLERMRLRCHALPCAGST